MSIRISPGYLQQLEAQLWLELQAERERDELGTTAYRADICDWTQEHFYIPNTGKPVILMPHQIAVMRYMLSRREDGRFPAQTLIYSTVKQSGKSTFGGMAARYMAETQTKYGNIFTVGNDLEQAKERSYAEARYSIELTPGYNAHKEVLPGRWQLQKQTMYCPMTGSKIRAVAVDAKGEAGGKPALSVWTELWGFEDQESRRFWSELTPVPTIPDSLRIVETYAGFEGESKLLYGLYETGLQGHQMTAAELATFSCRDDKPGETFEDLVLGWQEARHDPNALIPVWVNDAANLIMYWDSGLVARRMPWQHEFEADEEIEGALVPRVCIRCRQPRSMHREDGFSERYYRGEEAVKSPIAFRQHHYNEWVSPESQFVPMESWDACGHVHEITPIKDGDRSVILIVGVDAAVTDDCFAIIAVSRCPLDNTCVDIRNFRLFDPKESGGIVDFTQPEAFLRALPQINNVFQIAYDPFQVENMMQRLTKDGVAWCEPFIQGADRAKADSQLYDMIVANKLHHSGQPEIRQHIANANAKLQTNEDSKLRIVKKSSGGKIDLAVALSMAVARCMYFRLEAPK